MIQRVTGEIFIFHLQYQSFYLSNLSILFLIALLYSSKNENFQSVAADRTAFLHCNILTSSFVFLHRRRSFCLLEQRAFFLHFTLLLDVHFQVHQRSEEVVKSEVVLTSLSLIY